MSASLETSPTTPSGIEKQDSSRQRVTAPLITRIGWKLEDFLEEINWLHVAFKLCAYTYISLIAYLTWWILPINGHWNPSGQSDRLSVTQTDFEK